MTFATAVTGFKLCGLDRGESCDIVWKCVRATEKDAGCQKVGVGRFVHLQVPVTSGLNSKTFLFSPD